MPSSAEYTERVILDLCRWLFNQDVRIITFSRPTVILVGFRSTAVNHFSAIVLPIGSTLGSIAAFGAKNPILLKVTEHETQGGNKSSRDSVLCLLLAEVQQTIGEILNIDKAGAPHLSKLSLPAGYNR
ncbi:hypothetical protein Q9L58_001889 [Maublancomyces gigas]|uniref:Uncharacterized protein n=1 Tax=Discina gigas TaxID=1032678 RepID=A0ABR3GT66_9PEZI